MTQEVGKTVLETIANLTREDLRNEVAGILGDLLKIPQNATIFAHSIFKAGLEGLAISHEQASRARMMPILTKTEYPGAARATVTAPTVEGELLGVTVERRNAEGQWDESMIDAPLRAALTKMVLSQTAVIGDVYYVTTSQEVDNHLEQTAVAYHAQATNEVARVAEHAGAVAGEVVDLAKAAEEIPAAAPVAGVVEEVASLVQQAAPTVAAVATEVASLIQGGDPIGS